MKTITLKAAIDILRNADAIIIDNDVVTYPSVDDYCGEDDNEFMYCQWNYY